MALPEHSSNAETERVRPRPERDATSETRAIETVLDAERAAERSVAEATSEAGRILSEARERARRIAERADERIRHVHARSSTLSDQAIEDLYAAHEDRARASERKLREPELIEHATARVAAWLLGEDGEEP